MAETVCSFRKIAFVVFHSLPSYTCTFVQKPYRQLSRSLLRVQHCSHHPVSLWRPSLLLGLYQSEASFFQKTLLNSMLRSNSLRHICSSERKYVVQQPIIALQSKKRPPKKKSLTSEDGAPHKEHWFVIAYSTAEEYELEALSASLIKQGLYKLLPMPEDVHDVQHFSAVYQIEKEPREFYVFREGSVVFWNIPETERHSLLKFLQNFELNSYEESIVQEESDDMDYVYTENKAKLVNGRILLSSDDSNDLEKYTFSNGMAISVKLGIWEALLDRFVESIEWITENMKVGKKLTISRDQVFMKTGELYALRHEINLSSDLLDAPDFYWDRQHLETLYQKICNHFNVSKRTRVMNEKLNHCCELMGLISNHLNDRHHVRLELMIIALIMIEVVFEFVHYIERYDGFWNSELSTSTQDSVS